ncbi:myb/SANT-like DNA-binding domain-containing protein 4 [Mytilus edulis]|uniref:myb/SANT-like DNA-binding domain-containing protein 4 n=1 Tax=Mytilus edulis TaxID=6550 RepID=UPI0039F0F7FA
MADQTIDNPCPAKLSRLRKTKYSVAEENLILEEASKYHYILQEKHSNEITNEKEKKIWDCIAVKVNSLGVNNSTYQKMNTETIYNLTRKKSSR